MFMRRTPFIRSRKQITEMKDLALLHFYELAHRDVLDSPTDKALKLYNWAEAELFKRKLFSEDRPKKQQRSRRNTGAKVSR